MEISRELNEIILYKSKRKTWVQEAVFFFREYIFSYFILNATKIVLSVLQIYIAMNLENKDWIPKYVWVIVQKFINVKSWRNFKLVSHWINLENLVFPTDSVLWNVLRIPGSHMEASSTPSKPKYSLDNLHEDHWELCHHRKIFSELWTGLLRTLLQ